MADPPSNSSHSGIVSVKAHTSWLQIQEAATPFALQALVISEGPAQDGELVRVLEPAWTLVLSMLRSDPEALHKLTPRQFEELIAATYDKAGYDEVILTPRSGDFGRDVIAVKRGWGSVRIIDQAKCFKPGHLVDANDVRALLGVLQADRNASKGIVSTTSDFAPRISGDPFIAPFLPHRLELVNGQDMVNRLSALNGATP
jgi:restriction system protein